ncbi:MAG: hypothetical protein LH606_15055 [Cytophagaceae bacterium]|nr:hypothetical protein [Cytophagaceae bacterium]
MEPKSNGYMTWHELTQAFPERWVLLLNPQMPETGYEAYGGEFVYKNKNRQKVYEKASELPAGSFFTVVFAGDVKMPANSVIL